MGGDVFTRICRVKTSPPKGIETPLNKGINNLVKIENERYPQVRAERVKNRQCITCGRDISNQKKGSHFCSEKIWGQSAKKCRNTDSGRRRNLIRKIDRAVITKSCVTITYFHKGRVGTETIRAPEIIPDRAWLHQVIQIQRLNKQPKTWITGDQVKAFCEALAQSSVQSVSIDPDSSKNESDWK